MLDKTAAPTSADQGSAESLNDVTPALRIVRDEQAKIADQSDEELLRNYVRSGDTHLFEVLRERHEDQLLRYLRGQMHGRAASFVEDAFQQTWLRVHLAGNQFEEGRRFRPWLYTIARNQAIDLMRRDKNHNIPSLNQSSNVDGSGAYVHALKTQEQAPAGHALLIESMEMIREGLAELPDRLRNVLVLIYFHGMKYREAADVLSLPVGTVKSRAHAGLQKLEEVIPIDTEESQWLMDILDRNAA